MTALPRTRPARSPGALAAALATALTAAFASASASGVVVGVSVAAGIGLGCSTGGGATEDDVRSGPEPRVDGGSDDATGSDAEQEDARQQDPDAARSDTEQDTVPDAEQDAAPPTDTNDEVSPDATTADASTDADPDVGAEVGTDADPVATTSLCGAGAAAPPRMPGSGTAPGATPDFGTGAHDNIVLGAIERTDFDRAAASWALNYAADLDAITYDVRVPASYDGSRPFGLVTFINSGNTGGQPAAAFATELDAADLIWVAADGAGNSVNIDERMGRAFLGAIRATELWNVDPERVFAMGQSGGARSASMMANLHAEEFAGTLAWCGANYPRAVAQDYETHEPDSHYEFWGADFFPSVDGAPFLDHLRRLDRRTALMAAYSDFREGDLFNIYHNGFNADGLAARFLDVPGGHCTVDGAQLRDAVAWVEHPLHPVIDDAFDGAASHGDGWVLRGAAIESGALTLAPTVTDSAAAIARNRFHWADPRGAVIETTLDLSGAPTGLVELVVRPFDAAVHGDVPAAGVTDAAGPGFAIRVWRDGDDEYLEVLVSAGDRFTSRYFTRFADWDPAEPLGVVVHVWDAELQVSFSRHVDPPAFAVDAERLNDRRTVRRRWVDADYGGAAWSPDVGAVLSFWATATGDEEVRVGAVSVRDATGMACGAAPAPESGP